MNNRKLTNCVCVEYTHEKSVVYCTQLVICTGLRNLSSDNSHRSGKRICSWEIHSAQCITWCLILGCVYTYFAKAESAFWNADSKRRSKTPFTWYCLCLPREEDDFVSMHCACVHYVDRRRHVKWGARFLGILNSGYCLFMHVSTARDLELKWTGKAFIWRHLNVVICDFAFMLPPESAFCSNHDRKRTFLGVLNQRFETTFIRK